MDSFDTVGLFHLGEHYDRFTLHELDGIDFFGLYEVMEDGTITERFIRFNKRLVLLSSKYFINFEYLSKEKGILKLLSYSSYKALKNLHYKSKDLTFEIVMIIWNGDSSDIYQMIIVEDGKEFVEMVLKYVSLNGAKIHKDCSQDPVREKVDKLIEDSIELEAKIENERKNLQISDINTLIKIYQSVIIEIKKIIELYSSINEPNYQVYVAKLKNFMNDEKIQEKIKEESNHHPGIGQRRTIEDISELSQKLDQEEEQKINAENENNSDSN